MIRIALVCTLVAACGDDASLAPVPAPLLPPVSACAAESDRNGDHASWVFTYAPGSRVETTASAEYRFTLDSAGRTTREERWTILVGGERVGDSARTWSYDARGLLVEETSDQSLDGTIDTRLVYERDGAGWLERTAAHDVDGTLVSEQRHIYAGGLEVRTDLYVGAELTRSIEHTYDDAGRRIVSEGESFTVSFEYDEHGWLARTLSVSADGRSSDDRATFEGDRILSRVIETQAEVSDGGGLVTTSETWTYSYDCG